MAAPSLLADPIFRRLLRLVLAHKGTLAVAVVAMALTAATEPLIARMTGLFLDQGFYQRSPSAALWVPLGFVGIFVLRGLTTFASGYLLNRVSQDVLLQLRGQMFERIVGWPQSTLENTPSGTVVAKFVNEATIPVPDGAGGTVILDRAQAVVSAVSLLPSTGYPPQ
jgi:subfamily B ATP-binding cassette protein MsbA